MSFFPELQLNRRRLAGLAATAAAVPTIDLATAGRSAARTPAADPLDRPSQRPTDRDGRYELRRDPDSVVSALDLPVAALPGLTRGRGATRTPVIRTTAFSMFGVTWRSGGGQVTARFRRVGGGWSEWRRLDLVHDGPDAESDEAKQTPHATELVWTGPSDAVQLELGGDPQAPVLALIDPGKRKADRIDVDDVDAEIVPPSQRSGRKGQSRKARGRVPRPGMRSRKRWGANPRLTSGRVEYNRTIKQVHVHHTVSHNGYSRRDVPGMIRGMYRYHTRSLGWSDIGYNFLVDRFGRIWVGRRGGVWPAVRGAHTLGFNHASLGVAVIGNYQRRAPNDEIIGALSRLSAWKLSRYDRDPTAKVRIWSAGSDDWPRGRWVWLPVIDGHRQTNGTACPGWRLHRALPQVRRRAKRRIRKYTR